MSNFELLVLGALFLLIFCLAALAMLLLARDPVAARLAGLDEGGGRASRPRPPWQARMLRLAQPLARLALPAQDADASAARLRFTNAGWRDPSTPALFYAAKTALTLGLALLALVPARHGAGPDGGMLLLWLVGGAAVGYYLPDLLLRRRIALRRREIFETFPDALDLMTVCVEAGLAIDAALARVGVEIGLKSPVLAEELQLVTLELRAGSARDKVLRNLALRTGVDDVDALARMLIQAERFGTSVGAALRVQSDQLRTRRRQLVEEQAARIATKLLFPLIFCIFPALLVVLLGPAMLQVMRALMPAAGA